jgi:hypothetical protein
MYKILKKNYFLMFCLILFFPVASLAQEATGIQISPHVIDEKAFARDLFGYQIKAKNNTANKVDLYLLVNDILFVEGKQKTINPSLLDKSNSLIRWISISRGLIELMPGEEKEIPLKINVNMNAVPGKYYASITFSSGSSRYEAEAKAQVQNFPQLIINFEIEDGIVEKSQLANFYSLKNVYFSFPALFSFAIKNIGNSAIEPKGFVYIYNRRGVEVAALDVNPEKKVINPEENGSYQLSWQGNSFGKFKARIEAEYGTKEKRDLQDTIYFYVLPWHYLSAAFIGIMILAFVLSLVITRSRQHWAASLIVDDRTVAQQPLPLTRIKSIKPNKIAKPVLLKKKAVVDLRKK